MHVPPIVTKAMTLVQKNSPAILTGVAVAGVVTTTVLAVRATPKALRLIAEYKEEKALLEDVEVSDISIKPLEVVQLVWQEYIPVVVSASMTIACVIGAQSINTQRSAALLGAYSLTEKALGEYKEAAKETLTDQQYDKVQASAAKKGLDRNPLVSDNQVIVTGDGEQLCYESLTGRYFKSDIEAIRKAQNDINEAVNDVGYASQNDFFERINLAPSTLGSELGWTTGHSMRLVFSPILDPNNRPCLSIGYEELPLYNFDRFTR